SSFAGGPQGGFNWQQGKILLGAEADWDFSSARKSRTFFANDHVFDTYSTKLSGLGTIRGRLGLALDDLLIYGTAGIAFAKLKAELHDPEEPVTVGRSSARGWVAGVGAEYALDEMFSVKAEYIYTDLGSKADRFIDDIPYRFDFNDQASMLRAG